MFDTLFYIGDGRRCGNWRQLYIADAKSELIKKPRRDMATWRNGGAPQACHVLMLRETGTHRMGVVLLDHQLS